ncbi:MAG: hypothetical protein M1840_005455 [Geoglossum simile]|nr:MAG: hypothetical protein M1840_005455 [Geoglossum simile]
MAEGRNPCRHPYTELRGDDSQGASPENSRPPSRSGDAASGSHAGERPRVRFAPGGGPLDSSNQRSAIVLQDHNDDHREPSISRSAKEANVGSFGGETRRLFPSRMSVGIPGDISESPLSRHRNSLSPEYADDMSDMSDGEKSYQQRSARARADRLARVVGTHSAPNSARTSPTLYAIPSPPSGIVDGLPIKVDDIPLVYLGERGDAGESDDEVDPQRKADRWSSTSEAHRLVRGISKRTTGRNQLGTVSRPKASRLPSGPATPVEERDPDTYVPPPEQFRGGVLSSLLKLYTAGEAAHIYSHRHPRNGSSGHNSVSGTGTHTPSSPESPICLTPKQHHNSQKWYSNKRATASTGSLAGLIGASSAMLATPAAGAGGGIRLTNNPPKPKRKYPLHYMGGVHGAINRISRPRLEDEIKVTVHIAETLSRHRYLRKLCRALMSYGAPTHRLEEYMKMTARVLEINGQFLYIPRCMIISFDDSATHTTEMHLVRVGQEGVDLGKLSDTHEIYKEVVHDVIGVEEAIQRLDTINSRGARYNQWVMVGMYGLASATVGPFAFGARPIDMPIAFFLGSILGTLQLVVAPKSDLYSNVFEISAAVITSFLARLFGSIHGGQLFCFAGLAQSSIALILPGYTVLCGSLELQSKSIVAGSVRMFYAIIYSLFLGFGITVGTAFYGLIDPNASSETTCKNQLPPHYSFLFVPAFTMCLIIINQAKWSQAPVMLVISFAGYVVNYFSSVKFPSNAQISSTLGALAVGVLGNLYSRLRHGLAAAALLPAIFVQVPSGLAASGSLISGIASADELNSNTTWGRNTTMSNGDNTLERGQMLNSIVFNVGFSMVQVAIGITVGLFLSALIVYPFGKRRSGLFSF